MEDFAQAETSEEDASEAMNLAYAEEDQTLLKENALWLSRQAKKYSRTCKNIALFDLNSMVIFDFHGVDEDSRNPTPVKLVYVNESDTKEGVTLRLALLGFLVRGLQRHHALSQN